MGFSWLFFVFVLIHMPKYIYSLENWEVVLPLLLCFSAPSFPLLLISTHPHVFSHEDQRAGIGSTDCTVHNTL